MSDKLVRVNPIKKYNIKIEYTIEVYRKNINENYQ